MHLRGKLHFEVTFRPTQGRNWPRVSALVDNMQVQNYEVTEEAPSIQFEVKDFIWDTPPHNISFAYFSKDEQETVMKDGNIIKDQSLELVSVHADGILLEPWFWTDHDYYPSYFQGFLKTNPKAPRELRSQLIWHFPGRYMIKNLPNFAEFWPWYQEQRTTRVLKDLIDPTGQISDNHRKLSDTDRELLKDIKAILNV